MKLLILTSPKYKWLAKGCANRIGQFWKATDVELFVTDEYDWAGSVKRKLQKAPDMFIIMLEDYWINKMVNPSSIDYLALRFKDPNVVKIELTNDGRKCGPYEQDEKDVGLIVRGQAARCRSSLQAAIWRKDYFLKLCVDGRNPWEFELTGEKECMGDGKTILAVKRNVLSYDNMANKGMVRIEAVQETFNV